MRRFRGGIRGRRGVRLLGWRIRGRRLDRRGTLTAADRRQADRFLRLLGRRRRRSALPPSFAEGFGVRMGSTVNAGVGSGCPPSLVPGAEPASGAGAVPGVVVPHDCTAITSSTTSSASSVTPPATAA